MSISAIVPDKLRENRKCGEEEEETERQSCGLFGRAGLKCVEALGIIRGPYRPSNAIIYMHLQLYI